MIGSMLSSGTLKRTDIGCSSVTTTIVRCAAGLYEIADIDLPDADAAGNRRNDTCSR
jgi:hypothetical protein